jgi:hypothetical protein
VLIAAFILVSPAMAMDCARTVATLGRGPSEGVAVVGDLAVIGAGSSVVTFDMTNPADPRPLGQADLGEVANPLSPIIDRAIPVSPFGDMVLAFVYRDQSWQLVVIDPSSQSDPSEVGGVELPRGYPHDIAVVDSHAWIVTSSRDNGLLSVDLADPVSPVLENRFEVSDPALSVATTGQLLILASTGVGLTMVDVSDASSPELVGSLTLPGASAVTATETHAYVASNGTNGAAGVHVVDITSPSTPNPVAAVGTASPDAWPQSMVVAGDRLYLGLVDVDPSIAPPAGGLVVYDVGDPTRPTTIGDTHFSSGPQRFALTEESVVIADSERGLRVFPVDQTGMPVEIAHRNVTLDDALAVAVRDDLAYLADQGVRIIDIADHEHPIGLGSVELDFDAKRIAVNDDGDLVLALEFRGLVTVIDASDPTAPVVTSSLETDGFDVAVKGTIGAVADDEGGLLLFDLTDPANPIELGRGPTSTPAWSVALEGDIALVGVVAGAGSGSGLVIFDVSDPTHPILLSTLETAGTVHSIDADSSTAALLTFYSVILVDFSSPASPVELGEYVVSYRLGEDVSLDGDLVHVAAWPGNLKVIDFTHLGLPRETHRTVWFPFPIVDGGPLGGYGVDDHDGAAIVADGRFGLRIVSIGRCGPVPGPHRAMAVD